MTSSSGNQISVNRPLPERCESGVGSLLRSVLKLALACYHLARWGESGAGKSEIASELAQRLRERGLRAAVLQQDDYFFHPPFTNARLRRASLDHVGVSEVNLVALDTTVRAIQSGTRRVVKPLIIYEEDRITQEVLDVDGAQVVIVDGTYTTLIPSAGLRILVERTYDELQLARRRRGREVQDDHLEEVLAIEHRIIAGHREWADVVVDLSSSRLDLRCRGSSDAPPRPETGHQERR